MILKPYFKIICGNISPKEAKIYNYFFLCIETKKMIFQNKNDNMKKILYVNKYIFYLVFVLVSS